MYTSTLAQQERQDLKCITAAVQLRMTAPLQTDIITYLQLPAYVGN